MKSEARRMRITLGSRVIVIFTVRVVSKNNRRQYEAIPSTN
jgi:hypothetical protein